MTRKWSTAPNSVFTLQLNSAILITPQRFPRRQRLLTLLSKNKVCELGPISNIDEKFSFLKCNEKNPGYFTFTLLGLAIGLNTFALLSQPIRSPCKYKYACICYLPRSAPATCIYSAFRLLYFSLAVCYY